MVEHLKVERRSVGLHASFWISRSFVVTSVNKAVVHERIDFIMSRRLLGTVLRAGYSASSTVRVIMVGQGHISPEHTEHTEHAEHTEHSQCDGSISR